MAKFKCPHCGDEVELKVFLKDVTHKDVSHAQTLGDGGDLEESLASAVAKAYKEVEHPRSESRMSDRLQDESPLSSMFKGMHSELMSKREEAMKSGHMVSRRDPYGDGDGSTYLSQDKISTGESIANRMKNLFGGG